MKQLLLFIACFPVLLFGQNKADVLQSIKTAQKRKVSSQIVYPLERPYPLRPIVHQEDFINQFDALFSADITAEIDHHPEWIAFNAQGQISHLNFCSKAEQDKINQIYKTQKNKINSSVDAFEKNIVFFKTKSHKVRLDRLEEGIFRLALWSAHKNIKSTPVVVSTTIERKTTETAETYIFKHKGVSYGLRKQSPNQYTLTVFKGKDLEMIKVKILEESSDTLFYELDEF